MAAMSGSEIVSPLVIAPASQTQAIRQIRHSGGPSSTMTRCVLPQRLQEASACGSAAVPEDAWIGCSNMAGSCARPDRTMLAVGRVEHAMPLQGSTDFAVRMQGRTAPPVASCSRPRGTIPT